MRERVWTHKPAMNLLAPENLARIREALARGPIFGYWYRAHSGMGPNYWLAREYAEFERLTSGARPADYYVVWSLPAEQVQAVERYLSDPEREYFGVFFGADRPAEVWTHDRDGLETVMEYAGWYNKPGGEGYVFPFHSDWEKPGPDGFLLSTHERPTIERPEYWLLEAQYPNESDEVLEKHV